MQHRRRAARRCVRGARPTSRTGTPASRGSRASPTGRSCCRIARGLAARAPTGGRISCARATRDGRGRTWADPSTTRPIAGWDLRGAGLAQLASGAVLAVIIGLDKRLDRPVYNPDGEGLVPIANLFASSSDAGSTWCPTWPLDRAAHSADRLAGPPAAARRRRPDDLRDVQGVRRAGIWRYQGGMLRSHDEGRTWGEQVISAASDFEGDPHDTMWWDPRIARLADGTPRPVLLRVPPPRRAAKARCTPVGRRTMGARGRHRRPRRSRARRPTRSRCSTPGNGRVSSPFSSGAPAPARCGAYYSADGGRTFDPASETVVYEHGAPSAGAADGSLTSFDYLISMDRFTFGHPCGVPLGPDRALVVWYAGGLTRTAVHAAELRLVS